MKTIIYSAVAFIALICNLPHTVFAAGLDPTLLGTQEDTVPATHTADIPKTNNDAHADAHVPVVGEHHEEEADAHAADGDVHVPDYTEHQEGDADHSNPDPDVNAHVPDVTEHHEEEANANDQDVDEHVPDLTEHQEGDADHSNPDPDVNAHVPGITEHHEKKANAVYTPSTGEDTHAADANAHVLDAEASAQNDAAVPRSDNVHTEGHDGQTDSHGPSDNNYLKTAEDLKHEAHMAEMARKIAAEPVPPNSKEAAEAIASHPPSQEKIDPMKFEANAAAAIPAIDNEHVGGGDHGMATHDDNYLKTAEQLKEEADHLEESARKIAAAEPIPPNSKEAAEAIASVPPSEGETDAKKLEAGAAAAIPKTDNVDEGGEDLGSEDHPGPMHLAHAEILKNHAEEQTKRDEESARAIAAEPIPPMSKLAAEAISIKFEEPEQEEEAPSSKGYPVINTNKTIVDYLIDGDSSSVGVSLRYSMITGADKYQVCVNCVIKEGVRVNTEGNVKEFDKDLSPFFCQVVPPCVSVFEVKVGDHSFSARAHVPEKGWTNWSPSSAFKIERKEGVLTHVPHREL